MDSYKIVNKEIIKSNQEFKIQISILQKQITLLQRQLLDEHERRVIIEHKFKMYLQKGLKMLEPDITQDFELPQNQEKAEILKELRNSNSLHRRSSIVASPTRRSTERSSSAVSPTRRSNRRSSNVELLSAGSVSPSDESTSETDYEKNELEKVPLINNDIAEDRDFINELQEISLDYECGDKMLPIQEVTQNEEEELAEKEVLSVEDEQELLLEEEDEELSLEEDEQELTLEEDEQQLLTVDDEMLKVAEEIETGLSLSVKEGEKKKNEITLEEEEESQTIKTQVSDIMAIEEQSPLMLETFAKQKRRNGCLLPKVPLKDVSNFENNQNTHLAVKRGKRRSFVEYESIELMRNMITTRRRPDVSRESLTATSNSVKDIESSCYNGSPSLAGSELIMSNFADAASSTPNHTRENFTTNSETETTLTRASRRCKPKCLAEPNLHSKMRNETQSTSFKKKKNKSKR